ncbi:MAG: sialidase family protein [Polyangiaceae bacterium]
MNRTSYRFAFASLFLAAAGLWQRPASANGRFPAADQLIIDPSDPTHIVVRTTFGFVESHDSGKTWLWTCEEIIGRIQAQDPPFTVTGDGSVIVAVPFEGVSVTHDQGCTWTRAPEPLTGQLAVDVTLEPNDKAAMVVLTSTNDTPDGGVDRPQEYRNLIVETKDNGRTWGLLGVPLARDFIAATVEIAAADPQRIYTSGIVGDAVRQGAIERSEDGGKTWSRAMVPTMPDVSSVFISAIDSKNADRLFVRVLGQPDPITTATPTTLLVSSDKGANWKELAKTDESMLGFALSPDASQVAYGTLGQGVMIGPSDGSGPFNKVSSVANRCLTWSAAGLYACGTDLGVPMGAPDPAINFGVGLSRDQGQTFEKLYRLYQTCPTTCPAESRFNQVCRAAWEMKPGVTTSTGATGATCTVDWAKAPDAGTADAGGGSGGASGGSTGGTGGSATTGGTAGNTGSSGDSCSCRIAEPREGAMRAAGLAVALFGLAVRRRAQRKKD